MGWTNSRPSPPRREVVHGGVGGLIGDGVGFLCVCGRTKKVLKLKYKDTINPEKGFVAQTRDQKWNTTVRPRTQARNLGPAGPSESRDVTGRGPRRVENRARPSHSSQECHRGSEDRTELQSVRLDTPQGSLRAGVNMSRRRHREGPDHWRDTSGTRVTGSQSGHEWEGTGVVLHIR